LEDLIKKIYQGGGESVFPTKQELNDQIFCLKSQRELADFCRKIKADLGLNTDLMQSGNASQIEKIKEELLDSLVEGLETNQTKKPKFSEVKIEEVTLIQDIVHAID